MIIEFVGAPGSGKTTLVPAVMAVLEEQGLQPYTVVEAGRPFARRAPVGRLAYRLSPDAVRRQVMWQIFYHLSSLYRIRFSARHPRLVWQVLASQMRRPREAEIRRRRVLYWFWRLLGYYEFLRSHLKDHEALLLDEGFIHRVVQLFASEVEAPQPDRIAAYLELVPRPDLVIFVHASSEVCQTRVLSRGVWQNFSDRTPEEVARFVDHAHEAVTMALANLKRLGWPVVELDNGGNDVTASQMAVRDRLVLTLTGAKTLPGVELAQQMRLP